jgi:uncharacterized protein (TIRG00374 family)
VKQKRPAWFWIFWLAAPILLWTVLKDTPIYGIIEVIQRLQIWQIVVLVLLNTAIILLISTRWHVILNSLKQKVPFFELTGYRLAGFAVSYFTPGTQFGGEPLQVVLLQQRSKIQAPMAVSSIYLDKLFEVLSNSTFLVIGLLLLFQRGLLSRIPNVWIAWIIPVILMFPAAHLIALWRGMRPLAALVGWLCQLLPSTQLFCRLHDSVSRVETEIIHFAAQKPKVLLHCLALSTLVWMGMIMEFGLVYRFLGMNFSWLEVMIVMVLARLSFLVPVPAGLGALEGSQVLAMGLLGVDPAVGLAACLWIRVRDITLGLLGVWLGSSFAGNAIQAEKKSVD